MRAVLLEHGVQRGSAPESESAETSTMTDVAFPGVAPPGPGAAVRVDFQGTPVAVFNVGGTFLAIGARCPHRGGPLERGPVSGTVVTCPWHGSQFDLTTGAVLRGPASSAVPHYEVRVTDGVLHLVGP